MKSIITLLFFGLTVSTSLMSCKKKTTTTTPVAVAPAPAPTPPPPAPTVCVPDNYAGVYLGTIIIGGNPTACTYTVVKNSCTSVTLTSATQSTMSLNNVILAPTQVGGYSSNNILFKLSSNSSNFTYNNGSTTFSGARQ